MTTNSNILALAAQRAQAGQFPYAGAVTPQEAFTLLKSDATIKLIDVRTKAEHDWVGQVILPVSQYATVQWNLYPEGSPNPHFLEQLADVATPQTVLLFLCRSGVRSRYAAQFATENAYVHCYDILEGFEGNKDTQGHRKTLEGWCKAGLPWKGA